MSNIEINNQLNELCNTYNIGKLKKAPKVISGGLMHKMFKVITESDTYAIKWLNPSIIQREGVMKHLMHSELIANAFSNNLTVIAAKSFDGKVRV